MSREPFSAPVFFAQTVRSEPCKTVSFCGPFPRFHVLLELEELEELAPALDDSSLFELSKICAQRLDILARIGTAEPLASTRRQRA